MATAEELLARMLSPETEPHIVINPDRTITVPPELEKIAVQYDHDVETVTFDCPRYWDNHDLSTMVIYINYERPDTRTGSFIAENVTVDELDDNLIHFTWTISRNVTTKSGKLTIQVCAKSVDENGDEKQHWNSERNSSMYIAPGMQCDGDIIENYPDIVTSIVQYVNQLKQTGVIVDVIIEEVS